MRILVIEDDRKVARFIQGGLEREGHAVDVLNDGVGAAEQAHAVDYDAVVLDLMLPGRSGFQVLRDIRARKPALPVLILTAKDTVEERVAGLDSGADDYMVKPFALAELSARLRALLRRGTPRANTLRVADLELDTVRRTVRRGGQTIDRPAFRSAGPRRWRPSSAASSRATASASALPGCTRRLAAARCRISARTSRRWSIPGT